MSTRSRHAATPDEAMLRLIEDNHTRGAAEAAIRSLLDAGAVIMLPDPPRQVRVIEHDGSSSGWVEVCGGDALHDTCVGELNDAGYIVIRRAPEGHPG